MQHKIVSGSADIKLHMKHTDLHIHVNIVS